MTATTADYTWFGDGFPELAQAYCLTLVRDLAPAGILRRLQGREEPALTGVEEIVEAAFELLEPDPARQLIAMAAIRDWTLLIEPHGYLGIDEETALPASVGTRWVSHFVNVNGVSSFLWAENGTKRLGFEPGVPDHRSGTTPDEHLEAMHRVGFQFWAETSDTAEDLSGPAAFALAEHLTGVRVTPEFLRGTTFVCGGVEIR
jgi:hypothetical protein